MLSDFYLIMWLHPLMNKSAQTQTYTYRLTHTIPLPLPKQSHLILPERLAFLTTQHAEVSTFHIRICGLKKKVCVRGKKRAMSSKLHSKHNHPGGRLIVLSLHSCYISRAFSKAKSSILLNKIRLIYIYTCIWNLFHFNSISTFFYSYLNSTWCFLIQIYYI